MRPSPTSPAPDETAPRPEYLTARQVAEMLQLSAKSVFRLAAADPDMPQLRIGGSVRFPRERLMKWLRRLEGSPVYDRPTARHDAARQLTPNPGG